MTTDNTQKHTRSAVERFLEADKAYNKIVVTIQTLQQKQKRAYATATGLFDQLNHDERGNLSIEIDGYLRE